MKYVSSLLILCRSSSGVYVLYSYNPGASLSFQSALLKKVLARLGATIGSAGATTLSLTTEEFVVVELERRVFCSTCMSFVRKEVGESELSGMVSGATVAAEKVAWLEGRRVRKWWIGWVDMVVAGMVVAKGCLSVGMRRFSVPGLGLRLVDPGYLTLRGSSRSKLYVVWRVH